MTLNVTPSGVGAPGTDIWAADSSGPVPSLTAVVTDPDRATATSTDENITTPRYYVVPVVEQVGDGNGDRHPRQHLHLLSTPTLATTFVWWRPTGTQTATLTAATDARK